MSELSRLERERNEAWNELQENKQVVAIRKSKLELAEADELAAKQRLDSLNAQLAQEQEKEASGEHSK